MSKDYSLYFNYTNGQPYPDTRAINASGPTAIDGTELIAELVDDIWLAKQAELDFHNFPPDDLDNLPGIDIDGYPLSQPLLLKYMNYGSPGIVVPWFVKDSLDPAIISAAIGCDIRLLLLNGQGIDRTTDDFKLLDSLCYVGDTSNPTADSFYHANDAGGAVRNTAGDYLIMPDMRGYFLRGLDPTGTIDPGGVGRIVGGIQDHAFENITGSFYGREIEGGDDVVFEWSGAFYKIGDGTPDFPGISVFGGPDNAPTQTGFDASRVAETSTETRSINIATRYAIYY